MRLDGIEIKVTVAGDQTPAALATLGLSPDRPTWQIYFCEDVTEGLPAGTPLLDAGVILRARDKPGAKDDTTVKLRPCRRSQLPDRWLAAEEGDDWELTVEADWAGRRQALATSLTADRREGVDARGPVEELFIDEQLAFLRDCATIPINLRTLTVLPPVTATRWGSVEGTPPGLDLRAERWVVGDLDFLELSAVAALRDAIATQERLGLFVRSLGITAPQEQETKTRQVLQLLVEQVLGLG